MGTSLPDSEGIQAKTRAILSQNLASGAGKRKGSPWLAQMEGRCEGEKDLHLSNGTLTSVNGTDSGTVSRQSPNLHGLASNVCELVVVRHGLTDYNKIHRLQGQLDIPLNEEGRQQCRTCGAKVKAMYGDPATGKVAVTMVYSSPLSRTAESADIICKEAGIPLSQVRHDPRIMEWNAGTLQGSLLSDIQVKFPAEWAMWRKNRNPDFVFPGGESLRMRYNRVASFFSEIVRNHQGERVLVVTHGGVLDELFRIIRKVPLNASTNAPKLNAALHVVRAAVATGTRNSTRDLVDATRLESDSSPSGDLSDNENPVQWTIVRWGKVTDLQGILQGDVGGQVPAAIEYV
ncbi:Phosphoglycerate/bisphosphoglycerate mutase, related [Neospora caninum Liverpool]|uniref:Phosphoglycerate/bisphosphoglycerate mutase, related n=2 Tax=Neospora caninum (strain Liverpool) TaxID=572307 RepID=F0VIV9_NEOCL|nr:Phosphoglycerate/bisphosphoglycerate mutase, related [Neospora caninum Liverpool]CBZ53670.1 Phosphoglycerate/bisphosphoglycerate mutase, related [Neospora caninum Liverpool]|eukprot:XP_003883702.1 Phosphoglycerate/bisphosphoglycerate mutase, related [Neospora caninum Liverpool]